MPSIEARFWAKVNKDGPIHPLLGTRCWIWTGATAKGYGQFSLGGRRDGLIRAHRYSWALIYGPLSEQIDHRCHVKLCVNPEHLRPATNKQNLENRRGPNRNNSTGVRGVERLPSGRYRAYLMHHYQRINIGTFDTITGAEMAVVEARSQHFTHA
jgi:hypothetical protein